MTAAMRARLASGLGGASASGVSIAFTTARSSLFVIVQCSIRHAIPSAFVIPQA